MKGWKLPLWAGVALCAVVIGWMSCVAFYHLRVRSLLRDLRADAESYRPPDIRKTSRVLDILMDLESHGCRALPALIDEFHPNAPPGYLDGLGTVLNSILGRPDVHTPQFREDFRLLRDLEVNYDDGPAELRRKCEGLHRWWASRGHLYHQSWRFWSTACWAR